MKSFHKSTTQDTKPAILSCFPRHWHLNIHHGSEGSPHIRTKIIVHNGGQRNKDVWHAYRGGSIAPM